MKENLLCERNEESLLCERNIPPFSAMLFAEREMIAGGENNQFLTFFSF